MFRDLWQKPLDEEHPWPVKFARRKSHGGGGGGSTMSGMSGWLVGLVVVLFLAYIALNLVSTFAPQIGNLTYSGGGIGATIWTLVTTWVLPLAMIGLLLYLVVHFLSIKNR